MRERSPFWTYSLSALVLTAGLSVLWQHRSQGEALAADRTVVSNPTPQTESARLVPVDVLGTGVVYWAPATGGRHELTRGALAH